MPPTRQFHGCALFSEPVQSGLLYAHKTTGGFIIDAKSHSFGVNMLLLIIAVVLFVLAAFGAHPGDFTELDLIAFGLAAGFASLLL